MQSVQRTVCAMVALLATAGALMLGGCVSNDEQATAADVNNQSFTFPTGAVFDAALANIPTTLTFSNNATTFALSAAEGSATGTNMFGSCILTVTTSTYAVGTGPQVNGVITLSPCDFNSTDKTLSITNGTVTATSAPAVPTGTSSG